MLEKKSTEQRGAGFKVATSSLAKSGKTTGVTDPGYNMNLCLPASARLRRGRPITGIRRPSADSDEPAELAEASELLSAKESGWVSA